MTLKNPNKLFPLFISEKLDQTREFYVKAGFGIRFDMPGYLQVFHGGEDGQDLCFMAPHQANNGKSYNVFPGTGALVSIPTPSADAKCQQLAAAGIEAVNPLEDKPWGWRSFHVTDPNGVILDFFHVYKEVPAPNEPS